MFWNHFIPLHWRMYIFTKHTDVIMYGSKYIKSVSWTLWSRCPLLLLNIMMTNWWCVLYDHNGRKQSWYYHYVLQLHVHYIFIIYFIDMLIIHKYRNISFCDFVMHTLRFIICASCCYVWGENLHIYLITYGDPVKHDFNLPPI